MFVQIASATIFLRSGERSPGLMQEVAMLEEGSAEIDICNRLLMILPEGESDFSRIYLSRDRSEDLEKSER